MPAPGRGIDPRALMDRVEGVLKAKLPAELAAKNTAWAYSLAAPHSSRYYRETAFPERNIAPSIRISIADQQDIAQGSVYKRRSAVTVEIYLTGKCLGRGTGKTEESELSDRARVYADAVGFVLQRYMRDTEAPAVTAAGVYNCLPGDAPQVQDGSDASGWVRVYAVSVECWQHITMV